MHNMFSSQTESDFNNARLKQFFRELGTTLSRRSNELVSFDQIKSSVKTFGETYRGVKVVPIDKIVGTATLRYQDFDRAFLPTHPRIRERWRRVDLAYYEDVNLPPVQLYQVGDVYFVRDGHHRISVAREKGQEFIEAEIIQVQTHVPVTPDLLGTDPQLIREYSDFIEKTRIDKLRPWQSIRFSEPGGYERLLEHIAVHLYFLGIEKKRDIPRYEAVASWYDNVYVPILSAIREHNILKDFPHRTEADLYLWITDHHYYLHEHDENVALKYAAVHFAENYSERIDKKLWRVLQQRINALLNRNIMKPMVGTFAGAPMRQHESQLNEESNE